MSEQSIYFKFRNRFDFSPHRFEIGNPFIQNKALADNFFLKRLYELQEQEYAAYYEFHLAYFSGKFPAQEERFFNHVSDIVINRIKHYKKQDPFSSDYPHRMANAEKLNVFLVYLKTIDEWHTLAPIESVVAEKDREIDQLKTRISELEAQLKEATKYDSSEKIVPSKNGAMPAFMSLILQIQELTLPNENRLARSQTQAPWYKMIAKYFMHGDKTHLHRYRP